MSLTPQQLNDVAWALDALTKVGRSLLEPIAASGEIGGVELTEVTVEVTMHGEPISPTDARTLLDWLDGDDMQTDLRAEAERRVYAERTWICHYPEFNDTVCMVDHKPAEASIPRKHTDCGWYLIIPEAAEEEE